jgi:protein-S-isoprenylcysteine O-methyltransferase Ste14
MATPTQFGRTLFRLRSLTPLPVLAAILALLIREGGGLPPGGEPVEIALGLVGLACCIAGQGLRAWVLGQVRDGTSGQGSELEAVALNASGPYAHVRNPLYVGNFLICLGLAVMAGSLLAAVLGLGFFCFEYAFIVPAEEGFLRERFGERFDAYCAAVPRWLWRIRPANTDRLSSRFDWRRALKKEHNPFAAWASGIVLLLALKAWQREGAAAQGYLIRLGAAEGILLVAYVVVKGWKHRWWAEAGGRQGA